MPLGPQRSNMLENSVNKNGFAQPVDTDEMTFEQAMRVYKEERDMTASRILQRFMGVEQAPMVEPTPERKAQVARAWSVLMETARG
jgi:hypothetical protein